VLGAAEERVGEDEALLGGPGVDLVAALLAGLGDEVAVVDLEVEAEALVELFLPLEADAGGGDDEDEVDALAEEELLEDEAGLDGLAKADVVGDEEVGAGELEGLHEGRELVGLDVDPGA
jgi:hypothetical protein